MDYEKKYKWTLAGLILMVLVNAVTLFTIWNTQSDASSDLQGEDKVTNREFGNRGEANRYFQERLGLTDAQSDSIIALRRKHFGQMHQMREELETIRDEYFNSLIEDTISQARQDSMVRNMARKSGAIEQLMSKHMFELNKKLNLEQRREFSVMMEEMFGRNKEQGRKGRSEKGERLHRNRSN